MSSLKLDASTKPCNYALFQSISSIYGRWAVDGCPEIIILYFPAPDCWVVSISLCSKCHLEHREILTTQQSRTGKYSISHEICTRLHTGKYWPLSSLGLGSTVFPMKYAPASHREILTTEQSGTGKYSISHEICTCFTQGNTDHWAVWNWEAQYFPWNIHLLHTGKYWPLSSLELGSTVFPMKYTPAFTERNTDHLAVWNWEVQYFPWNVHMPSGLLQCHCHYLCEETIPRTTKNNQTDPCIKPYQLDTWIKNQLKIALMFIILPLQNYVSCGRSHPSCM